MWSTKTDIVTTMKLLPVRKSEKNISVEITGHHIRASSRRAYYLKAGSGSPVVLVHGGASDSRDWIATMAFLADRFALYAPDLIGFGQSEKDEAGYYLSDFSDFLLGFIEALGLKRPALVGHSFGARVCLDAAIKQPAAVSRLVLTDAAGLGKISPLGSALFTANWKVRKLLNQPLPYPKFLTREGESYDYVDEDALRRLGVPTLIIWKRYDPYLPVSFGERAHRLIPGSRLVILP
ncbi:MAG: alpha/beta fold hydrolase, partial [Dehalococcoidales bacterium]|nr:alpha/beta fold hydrolase [Dehalococcoidales bacterium]